MALISAYLAFFSVAVGMLRGLKAPDATHLDLMRAVAPGLVAAGFVTLLGLTMGRYRRAEVAA